MDFGFGNFEQGKRRSFVLALRNASHTISDKKPVIETVCEGPAQTAALKRKVTVCRINHFKGSFEIFAGIGEATGTIRN